MTDTTLTHRYHEAHAWYKLETYTASGALRQSSGNAAEAPKWLLPIVDMGMLAGANIVKPPQILMWFDTDPQYGLIRYKFTNQEAQADAPH